MVLPSPTTQMAPARYGGAVLSTVVFSLLLACSEQRTYTVPEGRTLDLSRRDWNWEASPAERFGARPRSDSPSSSGASETRLPDQPEHYTFEVPAGFEKRSSSQFRIVHIGKGAIECYLSVVTGGGVAGNLQRWRGQMGLSPYSNDELQALPKRAMLGRQATLADITGTYQDMLSGQSRAGHRMLGLFAQFRTFAVTVKALGPVAEMQQHEAAILAFCDSLRLAADFDAPEAGHAVRSHPDPGHGGAGGAGPAIPEATVSVQPDRLDWTLPAGWQKVQHSSSMRLATFDAGKSQCWIVHLPGSAGGLRDNINRWRGEVGASLLDDAQLASLPLVSLLGAQAPIVDGKGVYQGMSGPRIEPAILFGTLVATGNGVLFVKMVGPSAEMETQRESFRAFCASLRVKP